MKGFIMKKNIFALEQIKKRIAELKGKDIQMSINRGRKRFETISAVIESIYPSVFTVKTQTGMTTQTFSYFDVMCGDVVINGDE